MKVKRKNLLLSAVVAVLFAVAFVWLVFVPAKVEVGKFAAAKKNSHAFHVVIWSPMSVL